MQLGGWWRLWIVSAGIYAIAVVVITIALWPDVSSVSHHPSFNFRMSAAAQDVMNRHAVPSMAELETALVDADSRSAVGDAKEITAQILERRAKPWIASPIIVEMPNGHRFEMAANTSNEDAELVRREYTSILRTHLTIQRVTMAMYAFLAWLVPTVAVCVLGLQFRWVRNGFRDKAK